MDSCFRFRTVTSLAILFMVLTLTASCSSAHDEENELVEVIAETIQNDLLDSCLNHG